METVIKYTTDGRKVCVLGNLNSQEKIVQEIFVVNGSEIPSGEHFVVKSLHDAPAVSWKEKNLKEIEDRYEKTYKQKTIDYDKMCSEFDLKTKTIKEKLSFLGKLELNISEEQLSQLINFISGDVKYIVREDYWGLEISEYDETIASKEYGRFEALRLLSVFGKTNGDLCYKTNQYYDGSGNWSTVYPCKTMDEALSVVKELFFEKIKKGLTDSLLKVAEKYNIEIPKEVIDEYKSKKRNVIKENIEKQKRQLEKLNQELLNY